MRVLQAFYEFECHLFQNVNQHFDKKYLNFFFRTITHLGGAHLQSESCSFYLSSHLMKQE